MTFILRFITPLQHRFFNSGPPTIQSYFVYFFSVWHLFLQVEDYGTESQELQLDQREEDGNEPEEEIEDVSQVTEVEEVRDEYEYGLGNVPSAFYPVLTHVLSKRWSPNPRRTNPTRTKRRMRNLGVCDLKPSAKTALWFVSQTPLANGGTFQKHLVYLINMSLTALFYFNIFIAKFFFLCINCDYSLSVLTPINTVCIV